LDALLAAQLMPTRKYDYIRELILARLIHRGEKSVLSSRPRDTASLEAFLHDTPKRLQKELAARVEFSETLGRPISKPFPSNGAF
jgi:hypothetical protein